MIKLSNFDQQHTVFRLKANKLPFLDVCLLPETTIIRLPLKKGKLKPQVCIPTLPNFLYLCHFQ